MYNFAQMTVHISISFRHAHLCTNEYPYHYIYSSFTSLYEWLSILFLVFVMHVSVRMNIHILIYFRHAHLCTNYYLYYFGISSCTSMYKWLSILFKVSVMNIYVRMNIHILIAKRQLRFIGKVVRNHDSQIPTQLLTAWCDHSQKRFGVLQTNKRNITKNLQLIIPSAEKYGRLSSLAYCALDKSYWQYLIS